MKVDNLMSGKCAAVVAGVMMAAGSSMAMAAVPTATTNAPSVVDNGLSFLVAQPSQQPSELILALSKVAPPACDDHCQSQQQVQNQGAAKTFKAGITNTKFIV